MADGVRTAELTAAQRAEYDFLIGWFSAWPLFQDGPGQRRLHSQLAIFFSGERVEEMTVVAAVGETVILLTLSLHPY